MNILYGIKNCDSVKKAQKWLDSHHVVYQFHDFRSDGLTLEKIHEFIAQSDWELLLNKRSTSWRQLTDEQRTDLNAEKAALLMLELPTLIKRPVLESAQHLFIGFNTTNYQTLL